MNRDQIKHQLTGCFVPVPTLFHEKTLDLNLDGMQKHVRFLCDSGLKTGNACILVGGGAGEFPALDTAERIQILDAVIEAVNGRLGVVFGVQSTNPREMVTLVKAAAKSGAVAVQIGPPFYSAPTDDDMFDWMQAAADAADIAQVLYTTYWTGYSTTLEMFERLTKIDQVVAIKWSAPDAFLFEQGLRHFAKHFLIVDNQCDFVKSHMYGGRSVNLHACNYAPKWGQKFWELLESHQYFDAQKEVARIVSPYYDLFFEMYKETSGEGTLDKLCLEQIGLEGGPVRPPQRDIREKYRPKVREMLVKNGVIS
ncbi:MAG: dihydrodipicolinate synthase family protein [Planctomycetota bacterium]|nr:dihydrodipicolinate synthase family protein [Planctomycetota bacterium]MDA1214778.1 dihydrodipicolinate synthase family protein [Planctomycetota bacterium]